MDIKRIIGDYAVFFSDVLCRIKQIDIEVAGSPVSHLTYRTATNSEYEKMRDELNMECGEFVETQFNGRAVSILVLKNPLILEGGSIVPVIELTAPRPVHLYPSGLESVGWVIGEKLSEFNEQHKKQLTGIKDHGEYCKPSFVTFDNGKTAKFYDLSLVEIVTLRGWKLESFKN